MPTTTPAPHSFSDLLEQALTEPGRIHEAYTAFHGYSIGNQLLALLQCHARGIQPGPIATFPRWKDRGRFVMKGQKALTLCMPITMKREAEDQEEAATFTRFIYRPRWFVLSQTDGTAYQPETPANWDKAHALAQLEITEETFTALDGNCQGYARQRTVAVSPVAALPFKTLIHELAHVVLGHTAEAALADDERTPRSLREVEAEATAMLVCAALEQPGIEYSRGYIQHWHQDGQPIPERSAARIFKAADQILRAGREELRDRPGRRRVDASPATMRSMSESMKGRLLFSVRESPRFPRETWERFRTRVTADGGNWIDVLRDLIDRYATDGAPPHDQHPK